jgi:hypothetical protein
MLVNFAERVEPCRDLRGCAKGTGKVLSSFGCATPYRLDLGFSIREDAWSFLLDWGGIAALSIVWCETRITRKLRRVVLEVFIERRFKVWLQHSIITGQFMRQPRSSRLCACLLIEHSLLETDPSCELY